MLFIYLALAVLQRKAHCDWAYVNAPSHADDGYERVADAWRFGVVYSWIRAAGEASRGVLRCAAPVHRGCVYKCADMCVLCDLIYISSCDDADVHCGTAELHAMHLHHPCSTCQWAHVKEWHDHILP